MWLGTRLPLCKSQEHKEEQGKMQLQKLSPKAKQQATRPKTLSLNMTDQGQTAMGRRDGKVKF